jgi:hypothetical protein
VKYLVFGTFKYESPEGELRFSVVFNLVKAVEALGRVSNQTCPPNALFCISPKAPTVPAAGSLRTASILVKVKLLYAENLASVETSSTRELVFKVKVLLANVSSA